MQLHTLDWIIAFLSVAICFVPALFFGKRSGKSTAEFFASGRSVPWWLAGLSMVATTFSSDTPNLVANFVRTQGVAGNWQWWAFTLTGVSTVFFYARLWRRSGVLTDLEFYELRYSGKAASAVRGFRAVYLGLFFNCIIMATVNLAACKIAAILFGLERWQTLLAVGLLNVDLRHPLRTVGRAGHRHDPVLHQDVGGHRRGLLRGHAAAGRRPERPGRQALARCTGPGGLNYLNMLPDFTNNWDLAVAVFIMPIAVQWWAVWYPGAEPGGGSYIAQRMLASKSEKDALGGTLFFNVAHYVLRPWPWILVGLASLIVYPELSDIQKAFPNLDPKLVGHDIAYPGDAALPARRLDRADARRPDRRQFVHHPDAPQLGRVLPGARFLPPLREDRTPPRSTTSWPAAAPPSCCSSARRPWSSLLDTAKDSFNLMLQVGAGTGLLYLLRWFWWRITAWCEIVAMISSFGVAIVFLILTKNGVVFGFSEQLLIGIAITTVSWIAAAYLGPQTDRGGAARVLRKGAPLRPRLAAHSGEGQRRRSGRRQYPAGAPRVDHGLSP